MIFSFRSYGNSVRVFLLLGLLMASSAFAQDYGSMGISALVFTADALLKRGDYAGAIPALEEVVLRTKELVTAQGRETLQSSRFQLARALFQTDDSASGMKVLEEYLAEEPCAHERLALRMMAQGHFDAQKWDEVVRVAEQLLGMPSLDKDDTLNANLLLGQARFHQKKWAECIKPLTDVSKKSKDEKIRQVSQLMIVSALVESEQWSDLFGWILRLYRTDAKYDITLNLTLMKAGKSRFEAGEPDDYLNALLLYRMVLSREELIGFANDRLNRMAEAIKHGIRETDLNDRQKEMDEIRESMDLLNGLPPYEDEVTFRIGQIYAEVKRYWEGYVLFDSLYEKDRNSDIGEAAILQSVLILYDVGETARAEERVLRYLDEKPDGQYARTLLSMMMRNYLIEENADKVISFRRYVETLPASTDENELLLSADLHYILAFGYFQRKDYREAGEQFGVIIDQYPNSPSMFDAIYFRGMAYMLQSDYLNAHNDFVLYQQENEYGEQYASAMFREAVCLFGMDEMPEAETVFSTFIDAHPEHALVSEAYSMRGDIEAAKDGSDNLKTPDVDEYDPHTLDRALADYRKAIDTAQAPLQAAYAAFQAAKVYQLEFKWSEIIDLMNYYMDLLGEKADVAQAVFWIGKSQIELEQVDEAIAAYLDAIERFGNDVQQEGVDKIVIELIKIAGQHLSDEDRSGLAVKLKLKMTSVAADAEVLRLRIRVALAYLDGEEAVAALGADLLEAEQELSITTPISLAILCDAAVAVGDAEQMERLYDYFLANFEESDDLWHAYRAKTFQLLSENDYLAVLESIKEIQGLFGVDVFMGWAQMAKADTLYQIKEYEKAEEAYNMILGVSEWRGPLYAEAMYGMGQCRLAVQDYEIAHAFFQRTYLMFKAYADGKWAADGYLAAADCLVKLGREADAANTWAELLEDPYVNTLPQAETARKMKKKYGGI